MDLLKSLLDVQRHMIKKLVPDAPKLIFLQENKSAYVLFSFSSLFYLIGDKIATDCLKYEIIPSLKANDRLKLDQDVALNHVRDKGNHNANYCIKH